MTRSGARLSECMTKSLNAGAVLKGLVIGSYRVLGMRLEALGAKILTRLEDKSKQTIKPRNRN